MRKYNYKKIYVICMILFLGFACFMMKTTEIQAQEVEETAEEEVFAYNFQEETDSYEVIAVLQDKEELVIPDTYQGKPVASICSNVFGESLQAKKIVLGSNIEKIGDYGFYQTSAEEIILPEGLVSIGERAFSGGKIESVIIPTTVTQMGEYAFASCKSLTGASISGNCEKILQGTFQNCSNLSEVTLQKGLTTIGDAAFQNCTSLKKINLPDGTKTIGKSAFGGCSKLYQIVIPASVKNIGASGASKKPFKGCNFQILTFVTPEGSAAYQYAQKEYMEKYERGILTSTTTAQKIDAKSGHMYVGEERQINIYNYGGTKHSIKSSNSKVLSVSSYGILKAKKTGKAKITLKLDNITHTYTFQVLKRTKQNVCKVIKEAYVTPNMSDYEKVLAANKWLARNVSYDKRYYQGLQYLPYESYTAQGALEKGLAVCEGYSYAFMEIMDMYGISCKKVNGYVKSGSGQQGHAWNLVCVGGKWYHVDCTLNDPVKTGKNGKVDNTNKKAGTTYLFVKDSFMKKNHTWNNASYPKAKTSSVSKTATTIKGTNGAYLNKTRATVFVGKSTSLKVSGTKKKVTWSSSNKAIATVNKSGKVTGKKAGNVKITVKVAGKKYVCNISVKE